MPLPPGQRVIEGFPRFGAHLGAPPPPVPGNPTIEIRGARSDPFSVSLARLATLTRSAQTTDFHCVAGWSATGLLWEGVAFATFFREVIAPELGPGDPITHVVFRGLDGYKALALLEDVLAPGVMLAERLDGRPLDADHGAPVRLVSPDQYGYINVKHLCRIELHRAEPSGVYRTYALRVLMPTLRARVWQEERHRLVPAWALRPVYRLLIAPIRGLSARRSLRR